MDISLFGSWTITEDEPPKLIFPSGRAVELAPRSRLLPPGMNYFQPVNTHCAIYNGVTYHEPE